MQEIAIKFKKNIAQATIDKTAEVLNQIRDFSTEINRRTLELERGYDVLRLKAEVGTREMRRILKAAFPLTFKDIINQLAIAELHNRLPQFHEKIMNLGISACNELLKASNTLAARLLEETIITVTEIKKIVSREKKGFAIAPTDSHRSTLTPGTIVEIVKKGKTYGWLAEVIKSADAFGRLTVRLLKTCKSNQVFVDEVQLYKEDRGVDGEGVVNWSDWENLRKQYDLSDNDLESIRETAYRDAQQHASEEDVTIQIKWKHVQNALDKYGLRQKFSPIATIDTSVTPDSDSGETEISREAEALASALREMEELRTELALIQTRNEELETKNKQLLQSQKAESAKENFEEAKLTPALQLYLVMAAASQHPNIVTSSTPLSPKCMELNAKESMSTEPEKQPEAEVALVRSCGAKLIPTLPSLTNYQYSHRKPGNFLYANLGTTPNPYTPHLYPFRPSEVPCTLATTAQIPSTTNLETKRERNVSQILLSQPDNNRRKNGEYERDSLALKEAG